MIQVTKTFLPPLKDYIPYLERIWENGWITNNGPLVIELEEQLKERLQVENLLLLNNGTTALQLAIKALELKGSIITTPFSYVATTSSILWQNCRPVFADINPETFCLDVAQIEQALQRDTCAILATHVYGNICEVEEIQKLAQKHGLKVIYDGAHAFDVKYKNQSIFAWGDLSALSFHGTKVFHTGEGGALITSDKELAHKISYLRNAGHKGEEEFWGLGINAKNSELHAAMGLCNLKYIDQIIERRKKVSEQYDRQLQGLPLRKQKMMPNMQYNYAYYPILFESESQLSKVLGRLKLENIFPRRYFYPPLNKLPYNNYVPMKVTEDISTRIACLPLSDQLTESNVTVICRTIEAAIRD